MRREAAFPAVREPGARAEEEFPGARNAAWAGRAGGRGGEGRLGMRMMATRTLQHACDVGGDWRDGTVRGEEPLVVDFSGVEPGFTEMASRHETVLWGSRNLRHMQCKKTNSTRNF